MKRILLLCAAVLFWPGVIWAQKSEGVHGNREQLLRSLTKSELGLGVVAARKSMTASPNTTAACLSDVYVDDGGSDGNDGSSPALAKATIQAGIDAVCAGGTVHVYPGNYSETATGRFVLGSNGPHQFGLFIEDAKDDITIQGVDGSGTPIAAYASVLAEVATNATNNFGYSGIFVEGDGVTIQGLKILGNTAGDSKTFEIIGDDFTLKYCDITTGYSVYFNDWRYDDNTTPLDDSDDLSHVQSYTVEANVFRLGASVDLASGAGFSGPASGRVIKDNKFEEDPSGQSWPFISFNGSGTTVPWFVYSVGGAVITGNEFSNTFNTVSSTAAHIRARGFYDNSQFDWESYWNDNTFNKAVITLIGTYPPFDVRTYSYSTSYTFPNVRRIGLTIQGEIDNAGAGDNVLVAPGTYPESPVIAKSLTLVSSSGRDVTIIELQTGPEYLGGLTIKGDNSDVTVDGFTITGFDGTAIPPKLANTNVVIYSGIPANTPHDIVLKNNRFKVAKADAGYTTGDDGFGIVTYYNTSGANEVNSLTVIDNLFEPSVSSGTRAFYINPGVNQFNFRGNTITGQFDRGSFTQVKSGLVEENTVTGTGSAGSRSGGLGTWGYPDPTVYGHTTFKNNVITGVARGISIYETEDVTVENNFLTDCDYGVWLGTLIPLTFDASTIEIHLNSITNSYYNGVHKEPSVSGTLDAEKNWWASATGPTHASNPGGLGNSVSNDVDFDPWLCDGTDTDLFIGFQPNVLLLCCANPPVVNAGADRAICFAQTLTLGGNPTASGNGQLTYSWTSSPTDPSLTVADIANPQVRPAVTTTYTVTVTAESGCSASDEIVVTVHQFVFLAEEQIKINQNKTSNGDLHSNDHIEFGKGGPGTHTGNLTAVEDITIRDKNKIIGNVKAGDDVYIFGNASVTGTKSAHATVVPLAMTHGSFTAGGKSKTVAKNGSLVLSPGSYNLIKVNAKGTLYLSAGDYFMNILDTDASAIISCNVSEGPINIHVVYDLDLDEKVKVRITGTDAATDKLTFITLQDPKVDIGKKATVQGTIIAHEADVHFSANCRFKGSVCAEGSITLDPKVQFSYHSPGVLTKDGEDDAESEESETTAAQVVAEYALEQNHPNPFNPATQIAFQLPVASDVTLMIYTSSGQLVRRLVNREMAAGHHSITWNGRDDHGAPVASGVYLYILRAGDFIAQRKLTLMK